jgi:hypothetical protein
MSAVVAAERRAGRTAPPWSWIAATALVGLAILLQIRFGMMADVAWLIDCDERWLNGQVPYRDFLEINPPASLLIYLPAVAAARALGIASELAVSVFGFAAAGAALALSAAILRRATSMGAAVALAAILALVVLPGQTFAERDHLAMILGAPFVALMLARAERAAVATPLALLAGLGAGLMACVKPPYALIGLAPALYCLSRCGWRSVLAAPEGYVAAAVGAAYLASIGAFFPHYAGNVLPFLLDIYVPLRESLATMAASPGALIFVAIGATTLLIGSQRELRPAAAIFLLAALGAEIAYGVQGKGWVYQAVPALMLAAVAGAAALGDTARERAAALAAAAFTAALALFYLRSLGLAWALGVAAGFALEAARAWIKPDLKRLAPLALAAAVGSACGLCLIERPLTPALEARLAAMGPGLTLGAISEDEGLSFPLVRRVGAHWAMRSHSLIVTAAARRLMSMHPGDAVLAERLRPYIERDKTALLADLSAQRPDALLVGPLKSKLHADLFADPQVLAVMADYRLVEREEAPDYGAELWLRNDFAPLRP